MQLPSSVVVVGIVCAAVAGALASCGGNADVANDPGGDGGSGGSGKDASVGGSGGGVNIGGGGGVKDAGCEGAACIDAGPACGDGKKDPGEACDDQNGESGDGCSALCDAVEQDWVCPVPGEPCVYTVSCGD
jgi:cysteine-rich repeat protein